MAWDKAESERFALAWNRGLSAEQMAESFGMKPDAVRARIVRMRAAGIELRDGAMQKAIAETRRAKARRRLKLYAPENEPIEVLPSRFRDLTDAELADELGRVNIALRAAEADALALRSEFKARLLPEIRGRDFIVSRHETLTRRLDVGRVREHFGSSIAAFESVTLVVAALVRPVQQAQPIEPEGAA